MKVKDQLKIKVEKFAKQVLESDLSGLITMPK